MRNVSDSARAGAGVRSLRAREDGDNVADAKSANPSKTRKVWFIFFVITSYISKNRNIIHRIKKYAVASASATPSRKRASQPEE